MFCRVYNVVLIGKGKVSIDNHQEGIWGRCTFPATEGWIQFKLPKWISDLTKDVQSIKIYRNVVNIKNAKYKDQLEEVDKKEFCLQSIYRFVVHFHMM